MQVPSTADLKRRIGSVKNTQKITRAMKLVSAAKFNRAVQAVSAARPYKEAFQVMVSRLVADKAEKIKSPFFRKVEEEKKILLIALSTDRGLCGGLNANLMKKAQSFIETKKAENIQVDLAVWGRKAQQFFKSRHDGEYFSKELAVFNKPSYENVKTLMASVIEAFKDEVYDGVYLCLPKFESAIAQVPTVEQLLPTGSISQSEDLEPKGEEKKSEQASKDQHTADFKVEPSFEELIQDLLERGVQKLYR